MIDPLRFRREQAPSYPIEKPVFCYRCMNKGKNAEWKLAIKFCSSCASGKQFTCNECDLILHSYSHTANHMRRIVVVGPGVRKKVLVRGDGKTFPQPLDIVNISLKTRVYHNGKIIHRESGRKFSFQTGLSGKTVHLQILGCKNLPEANDNSSSDPFVTLTYNGIKLGHTRVRQHTLNPRWINETFVVPIDPNLPEIIGPPKSQLHLLKMEVFDQDTFKSNFLGYVELSKTRLIKMAHNYGTKPIRLNLSMREFHGLLGVKMNWKDQKIFLKIDYAESLIKSHAVKLSNPYCRLFLLDKYVGKTSVVQQSVDPVWVSGNIFSFKIKDILEAEKDLLSSLADHENLGSSSDRLDSHRNSSNEIKPSQSTWKSVFQQQKLKGGNTGSSDSHSRPVIKNKKDLILFKIDLYSYNGAMSPSLYLGTVRIHLDHLRRLIPSLPTEFQEPETIVERMGKLFVPRNKNLKIQTGSPQPDVHVVSVTHSPMRENDRMSGQSDGDDDDDGEGGRRSAEDGHRSYSYSEDSENESYTAHSPLQANKDKSGKDGDQAADGGEGDLEDDDDFEFPSNSKFAKFLNYKEKLIKSSKNSSGSQQNESVIREHEAPNPEQNSIGEAATNESTKPDEGRDMNSFINPDGTVDYRILKRQRSSDLALNNAPHRRAPPSAPPPELVDRNKSLANSQGAIPEVKLKKRSLVGGGKEEEISQGSSVGVQQSSVLLSHGSVSMLTNELERRSFASSPPPVTQLLPVLPSPADSMSSQSISVGPLSRPVKSPADPQYPPSLHSSSQSMYNLKQDAKYPESGSLRSFSSHHHLSQMTGSAHSQSTHTLRILESHPELTLSLGNLSSGTQNFEPPRPVSKGIVKTGSRATTASTGVRGLASRGQGKPDVSVEPLWDLPGVLNRELSDQFMRDNLVAGVEDEDGLDEKSDDADEKYEEFFSDWRRLSVHSIDAESIVQSQAVEPLQSDMLLRTPVSVSESLKTPVSVSESLKTPVSVSVSESLKTPVSVSDSVESGSVVGSIEHVKTTKRKKRVAFAVSTDLDESDLQKKNDVRKLDQDQDVDNIFDDFQDGQSVSNATLTSDGDDSEDTDEEDGESSENDQRNGDMIPHLDVLDDSIHSKEPIGETQKDLLNISSLEVNRHEAMRGDMEDEPDDESLSVDNKSKNMSSSFHFSGSIQSQEKSLPKGSKYESSSVEQFVDADAHRQEQEQEDLLHDHHEMNRYMSSLSDQPDYPEESGTADSRYKHTKKYVRGVLNDLYRILSNQTQQTRHAVAIWYRRTNSRWRKRRKRLGVNVNIPDWILLRIPASLRFRVIEFVSWLRPNLEENYANIESEGYVTDINPGNGVQKRNLRHIMNQMVTPIKTGAIYVYDHGINTSDRYVRAPYQRMMRSERVRRWRGWWQELMDSRRNQDEQAALQDMEKSAWSEVVVLPVQKDIKGAVDASNSDRGQIIVRLIPSTRGNVVKGLDEGVRHMTLGEKADLKVRFDAAYSSYYVDANIPPRSWFIFNVQLRRINGRGFFSIPYRMSLRFYRQVKLGISTYIGVYEAASELMGKAMAKRAIAQESVQSDEEESEGDDDEDEDEFEKQARRTDNSIPEDQRENYTNAGAVAGGKYLWGFRPNKRRLRVLRTWDDEEWDDFEDQEHDDELGFKRHKRLSPMNSNKVKNTKRRIQEEASESSDEVSSEDVSQYMEQRGQRGSPNRPSALAGPATSMLTRKKNSTKNRKASQISTRSKVTGRPPRKISNFSSLSKDKPLLMGDEATKALTGDDVIAESSNRKLSATSSVIDAQKELLLRPSGTQNTTESTQSPFARVAKSTTSQLRAMGISFSGFTSSNLTKQNLSQPRREKKPTIKYRNRKSSVR